jgi:2-amino-4-hydroxy-6-hydroxymethyldihydropteridine diphosphokinase
MKSFFSLGTNIGDKERNLKVAVNMIEQRIGRVTSLSAFYVTEPWGFRSENSFLNAALSVETEMSPIEQLEVTQQIERDMGRTVKSTDGAYHDRIIDIDLLMYGNVVMNTRELTLPHPLMTERLFVMEPLAEIAPDVVHPQTGETIGEILLKLKLHDGNCR